MKELLSTDYFWRSFYALCFVITTLGLTAMILRFFKNRGTKDARQNLSATGVFPIDAKRQLMVIKWQHKEYLLLVGPNSEQVIDHRHLLVTPPLGTKAAPERVAPTFQKPYELTPQHATS